MDLLKRREDENYLSYVKRITENRKTMDLDYSEWAELIIGKTYSSDNCRKAFYLIEPFIQRLEEEKVNDITQDEILNEFEMQRIELEKERKKKTSY